MTSTRRTRVAGVDAALKATGIALPDATFITVAYPKNLEKTGYRRHADVTRRTLEALFDSSPDLVVFEDYDLNPKGRRALIRAAEVQGILRTELTKLRIPFAAVTPATVKLYATGKGNANKAKVFDAARADIGRGTVDTLPANYDEADAYWLRAIGVAIVAGDPVALELLPKIDWPHEELPA